MIIVGVGAKGGTRGADRNVGAARFNPRRTPTNSAGLRHALKSTGGGSATAGPWAEMAGRQADPFTPRDQPIAPDRVRRRSKNSPTFDR